MGGSGGGVGFGVACFGAPHCDMRDNERNKIEQDSIEEKTTRTQKQKHTQRQAQADAEMQTLKLIDTDIHISCSLTDRDLDCV